MTDVVAIILAAGASRRMGGVDKLMHPILGRPVLAHTIEVFEKSIQTKAIVLVTSQERMADVHALRDQEGWTKVAAIILGGQRRCDSVRIGLSEVVRIAPQCESVMIHDGARPLVTHSLIEAGIRAVAGSGAAIPVLSVSDSVKEVEGGAVVASADRSRLALAQTPQFFRLALISQAHAAAGADADATDDSRQVERLGERVATFPGSPSNIKITTPDDLVIAEAFMRRRASP